MPGQVVLNAMPPAPGATIDATTLDSAILAGQPYILVPPGPAAFNAAATTLADQGVVLVRVANPLAAPLSLGRVMLQLASGSDADHDDDAVRVMHALAEKGRGATHLVVAVDDADTLAAPALSFLQLLPSLPASVPPIQVAFAGGPAFHALLAAPRFQPIRDALAKPVDAPPVDVRPVDATPTDAPPPVDAFPLDTPPAQASTAEPHTIEPSTASAKRPSLLLRSLQAVGAAAAALAVLAAAAILLHRTSTTPKPDLPSPVQSTPAPSPPVQSASTEITPTVTPAPPNDPAPPAAPPLAAQTPPDAATAAIPTPPLDPAAERTRLRREFDAFLAARPPTARRTTPAERDQLFREYLARRQGTPPTLPTIAQAVLIRYLATSPAAEAEAQRTATSLLQAGATTLQPAPAVPAIPTIRYFFPSDRPAALALAAATPVLGGEWQVEDATNTPQNTPGTLELWLPPPP